MAYKQVIVIRADLKMSNGKTAVQCAHASYSAARKAGKITVRAWESEGQKKVALSASLEEMMKIRERCEKLKLPFEIISDAGLTELEPGTVTAIGVGPDKDEKIDKATGSLPLLK